MSDLTSNLPAILPSEGLHVVHLFFRIERALWEALSGEEKARRQAVLDGLVHEIQSLPRTQILPFSLVNPKADLGFMLLTPDLQTADVCSKRLGNSLGAGILSPVTSYLSMTERSEYTTTDAEYTKELEGEGILEGTPAFEEKMSEFRQRIAKYLKYRVEPNLPKHEDMPVLCFYPMSKRRNPGQNWFAESFEHRKELMAGHAKVGRTYAGRVLQLITGSTGLDAMEWGVTLFTKTTSEIKAIVYEMRFDEVSHKYAEFGDFYIGIRMDIPSLCQRLAL